MSCLAADLAFLDFWRFAFGGSSVGSRGGVEVAMAVGLVEVEPVEVLEVLGFEVVEGTSSMDEALRFISFLEGVFVVVVVAGIVVVGVDVEAGVGVDDDDAFN